MITLNILFVSVFAISLTILLSATRKILLSIFVSVIATIGMAAAFILLLAYHTPSAEDHERTQSLHRELINQYKFKYENRDSNGVAVYFVPEPNRDSISIYGKYKPDEIKEIEKILFLLQQERINKKPIILTFYIDELDDETEYKKLRID